MKLKICMLIARFHPVIGGTELQAQRLAQSLIKSGNEVFILTAWLKGFQKYEIIDGLPVYRTFAFGSGFISSLCFCISSFLFLIKNRQKYDIIHAHLASSHAFSAILVKKFMGKKIILKFGGARKTGDIGTSLSKPWGKLKLNIIKKYFDGFITPGREVFEEIASFGFAKEKIVIIPNGVDIELFNPVAGTEKVRLRKDFNLPVEKLTCIYTGRLEEGKGLEILVTAWKGLPDAFSLLILGTGNIRHKLKKMAEGKTNIYFPGFQKNVKNYIQASDVFILPSFGEGISNALLEAMACGLVVIANKIPANEEIINNGNNGFLLNIVENTDNLISLISKISADTKSYGKIGISARQTAIEKFSLRQVTNQYIQLYKKTS